MSRKARQRISYVLELDQNSFGGHRLGVNGLAVDAENSVLYSGGRDGIVCAWDLNLPSKKAGNGDTPAAVHKQTSRLRASKQAHTHWVNDVVLAANNTALVSASSDLTVKLWRPLSADSEEQQAHSIGQHTDYAKCVSTPRGVNWVASGGLDRMVYLWDINGNGKILGIDVSGEEKKEKGSVYALSAGHGILANGGPENIVRLWDTRTGKKVTKFVGHTDMIRSILVNSDGDIVMSGSSDRTIKIWSVKAGRCIHTLAMHNESVWNLFSDNPQLRLFYSSDRSGLVVKTDLRDMTDIDGGVAVAIAKEHNGVIKTVATQDYIWAASASSSINRWPNIETSSPPETSKPTDWMDGGKEPSSEHIQNSDPLSPSSDSWGKVPHTALLRISNTISSPESDNTRNAEPLFHLPEETIEGQNGLVKHRLLNDRRRVLTLDTTGDVLLWDLIKCQVIQRFGKQHLDDVEPLVNTLEAVAPWCSIDTSSGNLTVVLELFNCFDAEMYADEIEPKHDLEFREDQRINLGKWILRYLFAGLIDEEIKRDEIVRQKLNESVELRRAALASNPAAPPRLPSMLDLDIPVVTPKANGNKPPPTPGITVGVALPGVPENSVAVTSPVDCRSPQTSRPSGDREDYFSQSVNSNDANTPAALTKDATQEDTPKSPLENKDKDKEKEHGKSPGTSLSKKFRMNMSFGSKKAGRLSSTSIETKSAVPAQEKKDEENKSESDSTHEKDGHENSLLGVVNRIRSEYDRQMAEQPSNPVETQITPSLPLETPVLKLPNGTKIAIQEETSGGSADLYRGTVETVGRDVNIIEHKAPSWLGEVLLLNRIPIKEMVKVSFILNPWQDALPSVATPDGNNRLNANRMLRVRKVLAYVAERIESPPPDPEDETVMKPEEYLELYCNDQLLPNTMSLATLRSHIWKGGSDVVLHYKANGRKAMKLIGGAETALGATTMTIPNTDTAAAPMTAVSVHG